MQAWKIYGGSNRKQATQNVEGERASDVVLSPIHRGWRVCVPYSASFLPCSTDRDLRNERRRTVSAPRRAFTAFVLRPDSGTVVVQRAARSFCSRNHLGFRVIALQRDPPVYSKTVVKGCASRCFNHATLDHVFWPAEYTLTPSTSRAREQAYPCSIGAPRIARRLGRRRE